MLPAILSSIFIIQSIITACCLESPNVIIILADDLGYGDLGWNPFKSDDMRHVRTPALRKMASRGLIMSNFHAAAPICSPSRASILLGLFPWRYGVDFIYAGDLKNDGSIEINNEQLPLIPNIAMSFRKHGYYCAHIGKWHLGGQSHLDIPNRQMNKNCSVPGINQYGFHEYVGMSEGTGSARWATHQRMNTYHTGSNFLVKNDVPLPKPSQPEILTDRQTDEAMRVIREQVRINQKFFLNLWYDAPHSPWEIIESFQKMYEGKYSERQLKYATMISNMDYNIGRLLDLLDSLQIENNTIVVFTSDNGPENGAGSPGRRFKGMKRLITEGGIRVPAIWQWVGRISPGTESNKFGVSTDLFPTLLDAAGLSPPDHVRLDGISLLPILLHKPAAVPKAGDERVVLWYSHCPGIPKVSAAWSHGYKLVWNDYEGRKADKLPPPWRLFDMRTPLDSTTMPFEEKNLLATPAFASGCQSYQDQEKAAAVSWADIANIDRKVINEAFKLPQSDLKPAHIRAYALLARLVDHLQLKIQWFRFDGETEWRTSYYVNKPYKGYEQSCHTRSSRVNSFMWSSAPIIPQFCGSAISDSTRSQCLCTFQNCSSIWHSSGPDGWITGDLKAGRKAFYGSNYGTTGKVLYLDGVLASSRYAPICGSFKSTVDMNSLQKAKKSRKAPLVDSQTTGSTSSSVALSMSTVTISRHYDVPSDSTAILNRYRMQGGRSCFPDQPIATSSHGHLPVVPLCPVSWDRLRGGTSGSNFGAMDENSLMYALRELIVQSYQDPQSNSHLTQKKRKRIKTGIFIRQRLSLLDPIWLRYTNLTASDSDCRESESLRALSRSLVVRTLSASDSSDASCLPTPFTYGVVEASGVALDMLVMPIPVTRGDGIMWGLALISGLSHKSQQPKVLILNPGKTSAGQSMIPLVSRTFCWLLHLCPRVSDAAKSNIACASQLSSSSRELFTGQLSSSSKGTGEDKDGGIFVLMLMEAVIKALAAGDESLTGIEGLLSKPESFITKDVSVRRQSLVTQVMMTIEDESSRRHKHLDFTSNNKAS